MRELNQNMGTNISNRHLKLRQFQANGLATSFRCAMNGSLADRAKKLRHELLTDSCEKEGLVAINKRFLNYLFGIYALTRDDGLALVPRLTRIGQLDAQRAMTNASYKRESRECLALVPETRLMIK